MFIRGIAVCLAIILIFSRHVMAKSCTNLPPGVERLRRGVDITKLDLFPLEFSADDGFRKSVIDFTCSKSYVWRNPLNQKTYQRPDQISGLSSRPISYSLVDINIYKSSSDVRKKMSSSLGFSSIADGLFSASSSYKTMQHEVSNKSRYIADATHIKTTTEVDTKPYWLLSPGIDVSSYISRVLPTAYNHNNAHKYNEFIRIFGTHYFSQSKLGGLLRLYISTDSSYYKTHTDRDVEVQAKGSFFGLFKYKGGQGSTNTKVNVEFKSKSRKISRTYGGNTAPLHLTGITAWEKTVTDNPWVVSGTLRPISDIIVNTTKKANMIEAVTYHLRLSQLRDLKRVLYVLQKTYGHIIAELLTLDRTIDTAIASGRPTSQLMNSINSKVEQYNIPAWFRDNVQLCYNWYADGDGGQCGGGAGPLLCARFGSMTAPYRDDTDKRSGGCQMRWKIQASPLDAIQLTGVQVCFKSNADGDSGQCGGYTRPQCVTVNSYTRYYRDDTDRRGGGCQMSWKLVVPANKPNWLRSMKICFVWVADGDSGQCGDHKRTGRLCAAVNTWTTPYRDDTDRRSGGCRMSWGLALK